MTRTRLDLARQDGGRPVSPLVLASGGVRIPRQCNARQEASGERARRWEEQEDACVSSVRHTSCRSTCSRNLATSPMSSWSSRPARRPCPGSCRRPWVRPASGASSWPAPCRRARRNLPLCRADACTDGGGGGGGGDALATASTDFPADDAPSCTLSLCAVSASSRLGTAALPSTADDELG
jgi:hypothetical protein